MWPNTTIRSCNIRRYLTLNVVWIVLNIHDSNTLIMLSSHSSGKCRVSTVDIRIKIVSFSLCVSHMETSAHFGILKRKLISHMSSIHRVDCFTSHFTSNLLMFCSSPFSSNMYEKLEIYWTMLDWICLNGCLPLLLVRRTSNISHQRHFFFVWAFVSAFFLFVHTVPISI